jgi:predicted nuclease of predicted toxin-antitoxin system
VKILLDENFPLRLLKALRDEGMEVEHIITLGWRGASDSRIREKVEQEPLLFLSQDQEFLDQTLRAGVIVVSKVRQSRPVSDRIELWVTAVRELMTTPRKERLFELSFR